jgi:hypothetical protein
MTVIFMTLTSQSQNQVHLCTLRQLVFICSLVIGQLLTTKHQRLLWWWYMLLFVNILLDLGDSVLWFNTEFKLSFETDLRPSCLHWLLQESWVAYFWLVKSRILSFIVLLNIRFGLTRDAHALLNPVQALFEATFIKSPSLFVTLD